MPDANAQRQLALAMAERERRRRIEQPSDFSQSQPMPEPPTMGERAGRAVQGLAGVAEEMNVGMLGMVPGAVPALQRAGLIRPDEEAMEGARGAALRYTGTALPFAAGVTALGSAPGTIKGTGIIRSMVDDIANFARARPATYFGSELAAAGAAGAAGEMAREGGAGPGGQLAAEAGAGLVGGGIVAAVPAGVRATRDAIVANLFPMTQEGGMLRASRQMQSRAGGAERAQEMAKMLDTIPEGVTPAQWIGDSTLLAQEARLLADNPDLAPIVRQELQEARLAAQESLRDSMGRPRSRQDWERNVMERVAAPDTRIDPGMTDEMIEQAYRSFEPLYDSAKGFPTELRGLKNELTSAVQDDFIMASDAERATVTRWINNQMTAIEGRDVPATTDDLLNLRSRIRDERRRQVKSDNMERADLLNSAEAALTQKIETALPENVRDIVRAADSQYRKYKVVENAIFRAGDRNFTPDELSEAIRSGGLTSQSRYARGQDSAVQEMRELAIAGRSTEELIGDPRRAALFVRGLDDEGKRAVQADFINNLIDRSLAGRATETTDAGVAFVSGKALMRDIRENRDVMRAIGMSEQDIGRTQRMAREISIIEQKPPAAVAQLFEDGPANVMQLAAALIGAKQGQAIAGRGMGSSLVLAQFMSNRARRVLASMTSDQAARLMKDAATDPELYRAMLTRSVSTPTARQQAAYLESWLIASAVNNLEDNQ